MGPGRGSTVGSVEAGPYEVQVFREPRLVPGLRKGSHYQESDPALGYHTMLAASNVQVHSQPALMQKFGQRQGQQSSDGGHVPGSTAYEQDDEFLMHTDWEQQTGARPLTQASSSQALPGKPQRYSGRLRAQNYTGQVRYGGPLGKDPRQGNNTA